MADQIPTKKRIVVITDTQPAGMALTLRQDSDTEAVLMKGGQYRGTIDKGRDGLWRLRCVSAGTGVLLAATRPYETLAQAFAAIQQAVDSTP